MSFIIHYRDFRLQFFSLLFRGGSDKCVARDWGESFLPLLHHYLYFIWGALEKISHERPADVYQHRLAVVMS